MCWLDVQGLLVKMEMCASVTFVTVHEKTLKVGKIITRFDPGLLCNFWMIMITLQLVTSFILLRVSLWLLLRNLILKFIITMSLWPNLTAHGVVNVREYSKLEHFLKLWDCQRWKSPWKTWRRLIFTWFGHLQTSYGTKETSSIKYFLAIIVKLKIKVQKQQTYSTWNP